MAPTCKQWRVTGKSDFQDLKLHNVPIPKPGDHEVLVQWKYGSLNYRDLIIPKASGASSKNTTDVNPR
jgi:NADPH:quinone reductase-like Zn-dependent oxidoreductase